MRQEVDGIKLRIAKRRPITHDDIDCLHDKFFVSKSGNKICRECGARFDEELHEWITG